GDGLQPPVAARLDSDAERLARLLGELGRRGPARRERLETGVVDPGVLEGRQLAVVDRPVVDEPVHGRLRAPPGQPANPVRRPAEAGALEQVGGAIVAPGAGP